MVETVVPPPCPIFLDDEDGESLTNFLVNTAFYKKIWWKQWMETIAITME